MKTAEAYPETPITSKHTFTKGATPILKDASFSPTNIQLTEVRALEQTQPSSRQVVVGFKDPFMLVDALGRLEFKKTTAENSRRISEVLADSRSYFDLSNLAISTGGFKVSKILYPEALLNLLNYADRSNIPFTATFGGTDTPPVKNAAEIIVRYAKGVLDELRHHRILESTKILRIESDGLQRVTEVDTMQNAPHSGERALHWIDIQLKPGSSPELLDLTRSLFVATHEFAALPKEGSLEDWNIAVRRFRTHKSLKLSTLSLAADGTYGLEESPISVSLGDKFAVTAHAGPNRSIAARQLDFAIKGPETMSDSGCILHRLLEDTAASIHSVLKELTDGIVKVFEQVKTAKLSDQDKKLTATPLRETFAKFNRHLLELSSTLNTILGNEKIFGSRDGPSVLQLQSFIAQINHWQHALDQNIALYRDAMVEHDRWIEKERKALEERKFSIVSLFAYGLAALKTAEFIIPYLPTVNLLMKQILAGAVFLIGAGYYPLKIWRKRRQRLNEMAS